jgi:hypothetical protein
VLGATARPGERGEGQSCASGGTWEVSSYSGSWQSSCQGGSAKPSDESGEPSSGGRAAEGGPGRPGDGQVVRVARWSEGDRHGGQPEPLEVFADVGGLGDGLEDRHAARTPARRDRAGRLMMSADQLAELIGRLPPDSRAVVERLIAMLVAGGSAVRTVPGSHLLDVPRVDGPGRSGDEIDRQIREERASWGER